MTNSGLSASDVLAMTKGKDGLFGGDGVGFIILLFIFIWAVFGGNGFMGGNSNALNRAELQAGLYNQTVDRNLSDIRTAQCNTDMLINNTNYNNLLQAKDLSSQLANCCCENRLAIANQTNTLQAQMTANTQAILDKLCSQEIQNLRDQLNLAEMASSNAVQTQNILNSLGNYYPKTGVNPYVVYGSCGCNNSTII